MDKKAALIIFAKTPTPNFAKTRLISLFTAEQAAEFYSNCVKDITNTMIAGTSFETWFGVAPEKYEPIRFPIDLNKYSHFFQTGKDLGERMKNAFNLLFESSFQKVAIIGSDFPHISFELIEEAFAKLDDSDCVLGPTEDGGYYLIAIKKTYNVLFQRIDWSTSKVYEQTKSQAKKYGITIDNLDIHYDVDTIIELKKLYSDLKNSDQRQKNFPLNVWYFLLNYKDILLK
jgi:hypothetical protein